ncbi:MAG TPA: hypothetical protein DCS66_18125 [Flavobacteriaceae bacterium]|nr:hypothetical protein [Flavobacteriaceae bacterium]HAT66484.1 hypothetical protein [Flavobacteriaceae bacterium]
MRIFLLINFFLLSVIGFAQEEFEYLGVIRLEDETFISYKIAFSENNGLISGFTVTDLGGAHETKSFLSGYFNDRENTLEFYESSILYTKSDVVEEDFCFVHFTGFLKKLNDKQQIEGSFKGLYSDGKECISGEIKLSNLGRILKRAKKIDKKVDKSILISQEKKDKVNLVKDLDSINTNRLSKNETLSIFTKSNQIKIVVYDAGQEDGDEIALQLNEKYLFETLKATSKKKTIEIPLVKGINELKVTALNNGSVGGNTVMIIIQDIDATIETVTNLKKGETASFMFLKKK